ncbi:uncharacterized protein CTRU02_202571 [Colletotrichum truncatum]|uniref:Uncharacterized protein n=1 Tax=Colletotrichum truncatum TaxID=5467 RepID=A0ACC3ZKN0_COLTU
MSDADSAFGEPQPSLISLRSSIFNYQFENGRRYHSMSEGKYAYPNDDHHIWLITLDGELACNPAKHLAKRVLDMGTGTGVWAIDFGKSSMHIQVIGVDLSAIQPQYLPSNCSFEIDDLEKDWRWSHPFDFIFCRAMAGSWSDFPSIIQAVYDNLNPGGYFEIQDLELPMCCPDGTISADSAIWRWHRVVVEAAAEMGRPLDYVPKSIPHLERAGFTEITHRVFKWPFNSWPRHPKLQEIGRWHCHNLEMGLEALSMALLTRVKGWDPADVTALCEEVKKEVRDTNMHGYWNM